MKVFDLTSNKLDAIWAQPLTLSTINERIGAHHVRTTEVALLPNMYSSRNI